MCIYSYAYGVTNLKGLPESMPWGRSRILSREEGSQDQDDAPFAIHTNQLINSKLEKGGHGHPVQWQI